MDKEQETLEVNDAAVSAAVSVLRDSGLLTPEAEERELVLRSLVREVDHALRAAKTLRNGPEPILIEAFGAVANATATESS